MLLQSVRLLTGFELHRIRFSGGHSGARNCNFGFHKLREISWLVQKLSAFKITSTKLSSNNSGVFNKLSSTFRFIAVAEFTFTDVAICFGQCTRHSIWLIRNNYSPALDHKPNSAGNFSILHVRTEILNFRKTVFREIQDGRCPKA
jgi:hypothetical protein